MSFDVPSGRMLEVRSARLSFNAAPHPYELLHKANIDANWVHEIAAKPAMFDGQIMLFSSIVWRDGLLEAVCHSGRFATHLQWRLTRSSPLLQHMFAHAMLVAADGSLVAVRMASHTANAGRVYFAAGSFDNEDLRAGEIDIASNMAREVEEEIGIDLVGLRCDPMYRLYSSPIGTVLTRRFFLPWMPDEIAERVHEHVSREVEPEIDRVVFIRPGEPLPQDLAAYMPALIDWHFSQPN